MVNSGDDSQKEEQQDAQEAGDRESNSHELNELVLAFEAMIKNADPKEQISRVEVLGNIKTDVAKWALKYERGMASFHEVYEEITALHVFAEMYLKADD